MSVIINEMLVEPEPPKTAAAEAGPAGGPKAAPPGLSLEDLRNLLRHKAERAARLRAH